MSLPGIVPPLAASGFCFSRLLQMHDIVLGWFINRYEFGLRVYPYDVQI